MFQSQFSKPGSVMHDYPADFQIWELGAYDDATAQLEPLANPTLICTVADLISESEKDVSINP